MLQILYYQHIDSIHLYTYRRILSNLLLPSLVGSCATLSRAIEQLIVYILCIQNSYTILYMLVYLYQMFFKIHSINENEIIM